MGIKITGDEIRFTSASGAVTTYTQEDAIAVFDKRKSDDGMSMKRMRAFGSASTFIDMNAAGIVPEGHSSARSGFAKGESIDIFVKDTYEVFHVDPYLISLGVKTNMPIELTGSLKVSPSLTVPHDFQGKYIFSGNPSGLGGGYTAGTGVEISGSLDVSGSYASYFFESMSMDISQGGQLIYGAMGVQITSHSNVTIEEAVITQPGHISQSFNIGSLGDPSVSNMIGVGSNCHIKIAQGAVVHVNEASTFTIQCPQPDVTVNTDTDIITLSNGSGDETVISTGAFGTNPQYIGSNYNVPAGNVAVWYGPIYIGRAAVPNSVGYLVTNLGSLRINNNSHIRIQAF